MPPTTVNAQRLLDDMAALAAIGAPEGVEGGGVSRPALSEADMAARTWFQQRVEADGFIYRVDGAGNQSAVLPAADPNAPTLLFGSHLDTVVDGGAFDGALGALAALEALRVIKEAGFAPPVHLEVISFTDEEGTHISLLGSRALAGQLTQADIHHPHTPPDVFRAGLDRAGLTPESILGARRDPASLAGYVEVHIEQGTRLENAGLDIGVVTGIVGIRDYWLTFRGEAAHAGTRPVPGRRDALWGAAAFVGRARERVLADFLPGTVNCGKLAVGPGAFNIVPGQVRLALEFRHGSSEQLDAMGAALFALAEETVAEFDLALDIESAGGVTPAPMDAGVMAAIEGAAESLDLSHTRLMSFAGHDTMSLSALTPSGMFFVPSVDGVSHNPAEYTRDADVVNAGDVMLHTVLRLAGMA